MAAPLATSVPQLRMYENLELHFQWICDGSIRSLVEKNLGRELRFLKKYLLSLGHEAVTKIIVEYGKDCEIFFEESGSTYSWVGVLRAAEEHWKTSTEHALFRTELEGISGGSPQLLVKTRDR